MQFILVLLFTLFMLTGCKERHVISGSDGWGFSASLDPEVITDVKVDDLSIRKVRRKSDTCVSGYIEHLEIHGSIGKDSTTAIGIILPQLEECRDAKGTRIVNSVYMSSGGGLLSDGFKLGRLFRANSTKTIVTGGQTCSSSCAIAFLGGVFRGMNGDGKLMYHAPYISGNFGFGINCSDRGQVSELRNYYTEMLGEKTGMFLLDRTMQYCSSTDGWTINGDAAEIFGILR